MVGDEGAFRRCLDDTCLWDDDRSTEWLAATTTLEVPVVAAAVVLVLVFVAGALPFPTGRLHRFLHVVSTGWTVTCGLIAFCRCWIVVGRHDGNYKERSFTFTCLLSKQRYF